MNSFWTGRGWELAEAGAICVLFLILGLWFGLRGRDRAYDDGYEDGQGDYLEEAMNARGRSAALLAIEVAHAHPLPFADPYDWPAPAVPAAEPPGLAAVREAGYAVWDRRAELWARQVEDPGEWAVPLEFPPALHDCTPDLCPHAAEDVSPATTQEAASPREWRSAGLTSYEPAWEPWSLSEGATVEEEVRAMIANANAAPSVRWLDSLEAAA
jgi:hypothetical protein